VSWLGVRRCLSSTWSASSGSDIAQLAKRTALRVALRVGQVAHAYLVVSPPGVEGVGVALWFARGLVCTSPGRRPCEQCCECVAARRLSHPDVQLLAPDKGTLGIDRARHVIRLCHGRPLRSERRVVILDQADTLTHEAQNALLKILEEPYGPSVLVLVTCRPDMLLPTVRSRCQPVVLRPRPDREAARRVAVEYGAGEGDAELLADVASGFPGRVAQICEQGRWRKAVRLVDGILDTAKEGDDLALLQLAEEMAALPDECLELVLDTLRSKLRLLLRQVLAGSPHATRAWASPDVIIEAVRIVTLTRRRLNNNVNRKLCLDGMVLVLAELVNG